MTALGKEILLNFQAFFAEYPAVYSNEEPWPADNPVYRGLASQLGMLGPSGFLRDNESLILERQLYEIIEALEVDE